MKIALIGYGKMGRDLEKLALQRGHTITRIFDRSRPMTASDLSGADVAIEFTQPDAVVDNLFMAFEANVPIVTGTTGWFNRLPEVKQRCAEAEGTLFFASNFSIGVYLFNALNKKLASWMSHVEDYTPSMTEIHHLEKKDAPSGTAITLAEELIDQYPSLTDWTDLSDDKSDRLHIKSLRKEGVPGTHQIVYKSDIDTIKLEHVAHSRMGFVSGAMRAAEWVEDKKGVFGIADLLRDQLGDIS